MQTTDEIVKKLCEVSCKNFLNPYTFIDWPEELSKESWFMSPEYISIFGISVWEELSEAERKRLSFYEAVNFFSLNIHGEKPLVEGLARRLYSREFKQYSAYLHHFLDEENKHMIYFGGFCQRYAGKIYRDRKLSFPQKFAPGEEDFLFFAKVMIFEEIVDNYNVQMAADKRLDETARKINRVHHLEETRHLAFGRQIVEELFEKYKKEWSEETIASVRQYLADYLLACFKEYYNPDVYKDAGLSQPYDLVEQAFNSDAASRHRKKVSAKLIDYLLEKQILFEVPVL